MNYRRCVVLIMSAALGSSRLHIIGQYDVAKTIQRFNILCSLSVCLSPSDLQNLGGARGIVLITLQNNFLIGCSPFNMGVAGGRRMSISRFHHLFPTPTMSAHHCCHRCLDNNSYLWHCKKKKKKTHTHKGHFPCWATSSEPFLDAILTTNSGQLP